MCVNSELLPIRRKKKTQFSINASRKNKEQYIHNSHSKNQFYLQKSLGNQRFQEIIKENNAPNIQPMCSECEEEADTLTRTNKKILHRMTYGRGDPPRFTDDNHQPLNVAEVPPDERSHIDSAISEIREVANNPVDYNRCHEFFSGQCPNGGDGTLGRVFNRSRLWRIVGPSGGKAGWGRIAGRHIAITDSGYGYSTIRLAQLLLHELMHNCGIQGDEDHHLADVAGLYCMGTEHNLEYSVGIPLGGTDEFAVMIGYNWLLTNIARGNIQLTVGAEVNALGIVNEVIDELESRTPGPREYGNLNLGLTLRGLEDLSTGERSDWGGERFGGIRGRFAIGPSVGRFRVRERRETPPGSPSTEVLPGFVIQAGLGAEFYIPAGEDAIPVDINAAYRAVIPLNSEAETIHSLILSLGLNI